MDCLEFRRRLAAAPGTRDPAFLAHRDACTAGCAESWRRAQHAERHLQRVLQSIQAPPELAERVLLAQATALRGHTRRRQPAWFALAASLVIASIVAGYTWGLRPGRQGGALAGMAIAHVRSEAWSLTMSKPLDDRVLQPVFAGRRMILHGTPVRAVFAADCRVGPYMAVHLVLRENGEPVTALYLVDHHIAKARDFVRAGWHGREMPIGEGTLVLLGASTDGFGAAEHAVADAILGPAGQAVAML